MTSRVSSGFGKTALTAVGVVAVFVGFATMRTGAAAQQGAGGSGAVGTAAGGTPTLQVYSRETVVDVTATDASGQAVHGLQRSDFTILEDGKPQPVRSFEEVSARPVEPPRELPPNVYTSEQPPAPSSAVNILLLDLENEAPIDNTNNRQLSRSLGMQKRVKDAAEQALQNMPDGTRVAVLAMTNNLRILQSFTADRELLAAAIDAVPYDTDGNGDLGCMQSNSRNESVLESFSRIAVDSAAIPGRKNLIWFTVGIPAITDPNERPGCLPNYTLGLSHAYDLLTASQVSVYPVDAGGVGRMGEAQLSEQMVAQATGGVAYSETNDLATAVGKAIDNGANYYSISYIPPNTKYDGAYHKIDVKVDRPGVSVVFRKGYYADDTTKMKMPPGLSLSVTPPAAAKGEMKAPMSRGMATSTEILFSVDVEPSTNAAKPGDPAVLGTLDARLIGKRLARYGFQFVVPSRQIAFKDGKKGEHDAALDFDIAVYDSNDKRLTGLSQIVKTTLNDSQYQQMIANHEPIDISQQIDLPPGQLFVRVGVHDRTSNKVGTLELPLKVGRK
jgi:VWFA-related protein